MSMNKPEQFDAIVIGTGQAGKPLALALAKAGWRTAVVERKHVGGSCINYGCTPTKTMVASARVAYLARRGADFGVQTGSTTVAIAEVIRRKQEVVESFRNGGQRALEKVAGIDLIFGEASFTGPHEVAVQLNNGGRRTLTAEKIFINTGERPARPKIAGIESVPLLDSTSIMEVTELPEHLLVLGGGYIGLEFGQMFRRFGSRVTVIQRGAQLLTREDTDVAEEVAKILREDGLEIWLDAEAQQVRQTADSKIELTVQTPEGEKSFTGTHLLVAAGRTPNTDRLNLAAAGVAVDKRGYIQANNQLETNVPGIYALGDIKGGPAFTHISYDDFRIIRTNLLKGGNASIKGRLVPYTVFIDPQLGRVGMTEAEARQAGKQFRVAKLPMTHVARAIEMGETRGFMKAIVETETNQILGCAVLGVEGGELMAMFEIAMMGRLPYTVLKEGIFAHPTLAESLNNLFLALDA